MKKFFTVFWVMVLLVSSFAAFGEESKSQIDSQLNQVLAQARNQLVDQLEQLSSNLDKTSEQLSAKLNDPASALPVIKAFREKVPGLVSCALIDKNGIAFLIVPEEFQYLKGRDLNNYSHYLKLRKEGKPVASRFFLSEEGVPAIEVLHPIMNKDGKMAGVLGAIIDPQAFLGAALKPLKLDPEKFAVSVAQTDGWVLYSPVPEMAGVNFFRLPQYQSAEMKKLGHTIAAEAMGQADYTAPYKGAQYTIHGEWGTLTLYDTNWRLIGEETVSIKK